jgi:hypothetical protein
MRSDILATFALCVAELDVSLFSRRAPFRRDFLCQQRRLLRHPHLIILARPGRCGLCGELRAATIRPHLIDAVEKVVVHRRSKFF